LSKRGARVDRRLVNSVLTHEGGELVTHNAATGKYSARPG
jgi:hypothetical protein